MVDYCQCTIAWPEDSRIWNSVGALLHGPESLIHHKLGPWQWQSESAFSAVYVLSKR